MTLTESTRAFLEAAFSATLANADRKKRVECIGMPYYDCIWSPKLDHVIQPNQATKADSYLLCLQQFYLDATAPLTAIIETVEEGELTTEMTVLAT